MKKLMIMFVMIMSTICTWGAGTPSGDLGRADLVITPSDQAAISYNNKYVDITNGDDANTGGYYDPWQSIAYAEANASAGTQIVVAPGTYTDAASDASLLYYFMKGAVCDISFEPTVGNPLTVQGQGTLTYTGTITSGADMLVQADILNLDFGNGIEATELDLVFQFEARKITSDGSLILSATTNPTYTPSTRASIRATESFIVPNGSVLGTFGLFTHGFGTIDAPYVNWGTTRGVVHTAGAYVGGAVITCERFNTEAGFSQHANIIWDVGLFTSDGTATISAGLFKGCFAQTGQVTISGGEGVYWQTSFDLTSNTGWNNQ